MVASGSQESASSLTSVILSMDLRISATRFSVSAPDTSCLKQTDTRAIIPAVHKQPATEKKARVPAQRESSSTQPRFGTLDFVCLSSGLHACALASDPGSSSRLREDERYRWQAGDQTVQQKLILSFGLCLGQGGGAVLSMWAAFTGSYIPSHEGNHKQDCYALV